MRLPFTVLHRDGTLVEDAAGARDVIAYEDEFRKSWDASSGDAEGEINSAAFWRIVWVVLRARHGEKRSFDVWLELLDSDELRVTIGNTQVDPTGESPTPRDAGSPGSPPEPESTPPNSPDSPSTTTPSSTRSKSKPKPPAVSGSTSGAG